MRRIFTLRKNNFVGVDDDYNDDDVDDDNLWLMTILIFHSQIFHFFMWIFLQNISCFVQSSIFFFFLHIFEILFLHVIFQFSQFSENCQRFSNFSVFWIVKFTAFCLSGKILHLIKLKLRFSFSCCCQIFNNFILSSLNSLRICEILSIFTSVDIFCVIFFFFCNSIMINSSRGIST